MALPAVKSARVSSSVIIAEVDNSPTSVPSPGHVSLLKALGIARVSGLTIRHGLDSSGRLPCTDSTQTLDRRTDREYTGTCERMCFREWLETGAKVSVTTRKKSRRGECE